MSIHTSVESQAFKVFQKSQLLELFERMISNLNVAFVICKTSSRQTYDFYFD